MKEAYVKVGEGKPHIVGDWWRDLCKRLKIAFGHYEQKGESPACTNRAEKKLDM